MTSPLVALTIARLKLLFREPSAMFWTFGFPILLSIALGIAFRNRPPEPVRAAVEDGPGADALVAALSASKDVHAERLSHDDAVTALRVGKVALVVVPDAAAPARSDTNGEPANAGNAVNPGTSASHRSYAYDPTRPESRLARALVDDVLQRAAGRTDPVAVTDETQTEKGSRYIDFLLWGLIGMNIMSSGMWGIGFVIVDERAKKLLKRMLATPMRRTDFLLSFVLMRVIFLFVEVPVMVVFGVVAFGIPLRGSFALLGLTTLVGALSFGGLGLLVASRARNTQVASGLMNLVMMPMFVGSGVFFSSANFPEAVQPFLKALPLTALNDAMRAIMNEGAGLGRVAPQLAIMAAVGVVSFAAAVKLFRWN